MQVSGERIIAKTLFKELRGHGYSANQILGLTNDLLDLVTLELHERSLAAAAMEGEGSDPGEPTTADTE